MNKMLLNTIRILCERMSIKLACRGISDDGICGNMEISLTSRYYKKYVAEWMKEQYPHWEHFSGNYAYPVPAPESFTNTIREFMAESELPHGFTVEGECAKLYFYEMRHNGDGLWCQDEYGNKRRQLAQFLAQRATDEMRSL